jgi:hypothetical protein
MKKSLVFLAIACLILAVSSISLAYGGPGHSDPVIEQRHEGVIDGNDRVFDSGTLTVKVHKMARVDFLESTADDINFFNLDRASDTDKFKFKVESNCQIAGQFKGYKFKNHDGALETGYRAINYGPGPNNYVIATLTNPVEIGVSFNGDGGVWEKEFEVKANIAERQKAGTYNADVFLYVWAD